MGGVFWRLYGSHKGISLRDLSGPGRGLHIHGWRGSCTLGSDQNAIQSLKFNVRYQICSGYLSSVGPGLTPL